MGFFTNLFTKDKTIKGIWQDQKELFMLMHSENAKLRAEIKEIREQLADSTHLNLKLDCALQSINDLEVKQDVLLSAQYDLKADLETQIDKLKLEIDLLKQAKTKGV